MKLEGRTITTLEVASMMEVSHSDILRKLEGRKDRKGYIQILGESQMAISDFFIKSKYYTEQNKEMPCYEVTRLGCDFLANKFTGEKGVLFTARYVKRFHEMEQELVTASPSEIPLGELASYLKIMDRIAHRQNLSPHRIAANFKKVSEQFGVELTEDFVRVPAYEQMTLDVVMR